MTMTFNDTTFEVVTPSRSFYLFLNDTMMLGSDSSDSIWKAKQYVLNTLVTLGISYEKKQGLAEGSDGYMHEVTHIKTT